MNSELDQHLDGLWKLFSQRMDESGIGTSEVPSFLIYHYTTAAGVKGILEGKHIYATHFRGYGSILMEWPASIRLVSESLGEGV